MKPRPFSLWLLPFGSDDTPWQGYALLERNPRLKEGKKLLEKISKDIFSETVGEPTIFYFQKSGDRCACSMIEDENCFLGIASSPDKAREILYARALELGKRHFSLGGYRRFVDYCGNKPRVIESLN